MAINPEPLKGRVALVAGASSGMGAAIATALAEAGAKVYAGARRESVIAEAVGPELVDNGAVVPLALDITEADEVDAVLGRLAADDPIDLLVCSAGINIRNRRFWELDEASLLQVLQTNLIGAFRLLSGARQMLERDGGDAVFISSVSAHWPDHAGAAYAASKAGLNALAAGAARDIHGSGVRVTTVNPGIVDTPLLDKRPVVPPAEVREWCTKPEDVAAAVLAAVSLPQRAHITDMTIVSTRLQSMGNTQQATPELAEPRN